MLAISTESEKRRHFRSQYQEKVEYVFSDPTSEHLESRRFPILCPNIRWRIIMWRENDEAHKRKAHEAQVDVAQIVEWRHDDEPYHGEFDHVVEKQWSVEVIW